MNYRYHSTALFALALLASCGKSNSPAPDTPSQVTVSTFAGNGTAGYQDGGALNAEFSNPEGLAIDQLNNIFIADAHNYRIRKISADGQVTTLAGDGNNGYRNGQGSSAEFTYPMNGLSIDKSGNLYLANTNRVRSISPSGAVSLFAGNGAEGYIDGKSDNAEFNHASSTIVDNKNNVFVTDFYGNMIRKITPEGVVSTFAGDGKLGFKDGDASTAEFAFSGYQGDGHAAITIDASNNLYVCDCGNNCIRKITPSGIVSTYAGNGKAGAIDGAALNAEFSNPTGIAIDKNGNVFVSDNGNLKIRKISPSGTVSTIAGTGNAGLVNGPGVSAAFKGLLDMVFDSKGNLYVSDPANNCIRKIAF